MEVLVSVFSLLVGRSYSMVELLHVFAVMVATSICHSHINICGSSLTLVRLHVASNFFCATEHRKNTAAVDAKEVWSKR